MCDDVCVQVSCARCGTSGTMTVATDAAPAAGGKGGTPSGAHAAQGECAHCHHPWHLVLRSRFLHEHSNVLCVLKPSGLTPVDLLPASVLAAQCSECSHIVTFRNVLAGAPARRPCSSCHRELGLSWLAVSWVPRGAPPGARAGGGGAAGGGAARARAPGGGRGPGRPGPIQAGQPLPALGTCKHYTHSHRWFRCVRGSRGRCGGWVWWALTVLCCASWWRSQVSLLWPGLPLRHLPRGAGARRPRGALRGAHDLR